MTKTLYLTYFLATTMKRLQYGTLKFSQLTSLYTPHTYQRTTGNAE